jgi:hypothetical protein
MKSGTADYNGPSTPQDGEVLCAIITPASTEQRQPPHTAQHCTCVQPQAPYGMQAVSHKQTQPLGSAQVASHGLDSQEVSWTLTQVSWTLRRHHNLEHGMA